MAEGEELERGRGLDGGDPRLLVEKRKLPDDLARPDGGQDVSLPDDLGVAGDDDVGGTAVLALSGQHPACFDLFLDEDIGDRGQLPMRAITEEWQPFDSSRLSFLCR